MNLPLAILSETRWGPGGLQNCVALIFFQYRWSRPVLHGALICMIEAAQQPGSVRGRQARLLRRFHCPAADRAGQQPTRFRRAAASAARYGSGSTARRSCFRIRRAAAAAAHRHYCPPPHPSPGYSFPGCLHWQPGQSLSPRQPAPGPACATAPIIGSRHRCGDSDPGRARSGPPALRRRATETSAARARLRLSDSDRLSVTTIRVIVVVTTAK